jgi:hypothetical protein
MPKGEQRGREKKKPKKDKAAKHQSAYASEYGKHQQPTHITDSGTNKKQ